MFYTVENFGFKEFEFDLPFKCEVHHCFPRALPSKEKFSVLIHYMEPFQLKWSNEEVRKYYSIFNLILTNEDSLLDLPNAVFACMGGKWVKSRPNQKFFNLSFLYSGGIGSDHLFSGYTHRRELWHKRQKIIIPNTFYTSIHRPPHQIIDLNPYPFSNKDQLFNSMFSVVIENDYQKNYFSEKLIDAFATFTIPIYLGSPNINSFFDTNGMLLPKSIDELIDIVNSLNSDYYWENIESLNNNYLRSKEYWDVIGNLKQAILDSFDKFY